jgi:hypothetical protein
MRYATSYKYYYVNYCRNTPEQSFLNCARSQNFLYADRLARTRS